MKTRGELIIPDSAKEKPMEGKVIAVRNGKVNLARRNRDDAAQAPAARAGWGCSSASKSPEAEPAVNVILDLLHIGEQAREDTLAGYPIPGLKQARPAPGSILLRSATKGILALSDAAALREALLS